MYSMFERGRSVQWLSLVHTGLFLLLRRGVSNEQVGAQSAARLTGTGRIMRRVGRKAWRARVAYMMARLSGEGSSSTVTGSRDLLLKL
jgi:hypothetical protein